MLEVIHEQSGDRAEAETPEAIIRAAHQLSSDHARASLGTDRNATFTFVGTDGKVIATGVRQQGLS